MNVIPKHIILYVFKFFKKLYLPWLRLVCKNWADLIKERRCEVCTIIRESELITIRLLFELEKYVPLKSPKLLNMLCYKKPSPYKVQQLELFRIFGLNKCNSLWFDLIPDLETIHWLENNIDRMISHIESFIIYSELVGVIIRHDNVEMINWLCDQNIKFIISSDVLMTKENIDKLKVNDVDKFYLYVRNGYWDRKTIPSNINKYRLFHHAIANGDLDLIKYIYSIFRPPIKTIYYYIAGKNVAINEFLLSCPRQRLKIRYLRDIDRITHLKELIHLGYYTPKTKNYVKAISHQFMDVILFIEWYCQPDEDILDKVAVYCINNKINFVRSTACQVLHWSLTKKLKFTEKFISYLCSYSNQQVLEFLLQHNFKLTSDAYILAFKNAEFSFFDTLLKSGLKINDGFRYILQRGSSKATKWFNTHFYL